MHLELLRGVIFCPRNLDHQKWNTNSFFYWLKHLNEVGKVIFFSGLFDQNCIFATPQSPHHLIMLSSQINCIHLKTLGNNCFFFIHQFQLRVFLFTKWPYPNDKFIIGLIFRFPKILSTTLLKDAGDCLHSWRILRMELRKSIWWIRFGQLWTGEKLRFYGKFLNWSEIEMECLLYSYRV